MTRSHPVKGGELQGSVFSHEVDFRSASEAKREFADTENKQWVQERLLDYYHGSRG